MPLGLVLEVVHLGLFCDEAKEHAASLRRNVLAIRMPMSDAPFVETIHRLAFFYNKIIGC